MKEAQPWVTLSQTGERSAARKRRGVRPESGARCASSAGARLLWWGATNPVTSVMKPRTATPLADRLNLHWSYWRVSEV